MIELINEPLIPEEIQTFEYYKKKLPLYLRNSESFQSHFKIWHDLLTEKGINGKGQILINLLNIFADDYFTFLEENEGVGETDTESDILNTIGNLFGISRYNLVEYNDGTSDISEYITLNNKDFLIYIKARIIQNCCDGTRKTIQSFYDSLGITDEIGLSLKMLSNPEGHAAEVQMYLLLESSEAELTNLDKLFLSGLLTIESMGITYRYSQPFTVDSILKWANLDGTGGQNEWDTGRWLI